MLAPLGLIILSLAFYWGVIRVLEIYRTYRWDQRCPVQHCGWESLPAPVLAHFQQSLGVMAPLGFAPECQLVYPYPDSQHQLYELLLIHSDQITRLSVRVRHYDDPLYSPVFYCHFLADLTDGQRVEVTNTLEYLCWGTDERETVYYFPDLQDLARLHALHQFALQQHGGSGRVVTVESDNILESRDEAWEQMNARLVRQGILRLDAAQDRHVCTLLGAYHFLLYEEPFLYFSELGPRRKSAQLEADYELRTLRRR